MKEDEGLKNLHFKEAQANRPLCHFCSEHADYKLSLFRGVLASDDLNVCRSCIENETDVGVAIADASRVRIVSYDTGRYTTGAPDKLQALLRTLMPQRGFKTITSAIRIAAGKPKERILMCAACREAISPETPGFVRWAMDENGKFHSIRLFHLECWTNPGKTAAPDEWADLDRIEKLDRSRFTLSAVEILDQIEKKWKLLNEYATRKK